MKKKINLIQKKWFLEGNNRYDTQPVFRARVAAHKIPLPKIHHFLQKTKLTAELINLSDQKEISSWKLIIKTLFFIGDIPLTYYEEVPINEHESLVIFNCVSLEVGKLIINHAQDIIQSNLELKPASYTSEIRALWKKHALTPMLSRYIEEANKRNIPNIILQRNPFILQLGYGSKMRRVWSAISNNTSKIATKLTANKYSLNTLLNKIDIPVSNPKIIKDESDLMVYLDELDSPVVIKPADSTVGKGVSLNIKSFPEAKRAYSEALKISKKVIMESQIEGIYYRLTFVDSQLIACAKSYPAKVIGDGKSTVAQLIKEENKQPYRQDKDKNKSFYKIELTPKLKTILSFQGLKLSSRVPKNQEVLLSFSGADGGEWVEDNQSVHPENIKIIQRALAFCGLDIAGVDVISPDISIPLTDNGGKVLEINAGPDTHIHMNVNRGRKISIERAIINYLFPKNESGRIPLISITGTNGKTTTSKLISHLIQNPAQWTIGLTTSDNKYINGELVAQGDKSGFLSARSLLMNPEIDVAILETCHILGIDKKGLGYDWSDASVITNLSGDHVGTYCTLTENDLFLIKSVVTKRTKKDGFLILNADDPQVVKMTPLTPAKVVFFSLDRNNQFIQKNISQNLPVYYRENNSLFEEKEGVRTKLADIDKIHITHSGEALFNIYNTLGALAAVRLTFGEKVSLSDIQNKLQTFGEDPSYNPGRFNLIEKNGFKVIIDYAHNPDGYRKTIELAKKIDHQRLVGVIKAAGDRPNDFIHQLGQISGRNFDYIYIKDPSPEKTRGREKGTVSNILKRGALSSGFSEEKIEVVHDEKKAVEKALKNAQKGDLILIFVHNIPQVINQVVNF